MGVDSLIVNDEAHLTPAFAKLLKNVELLQPAKRFASYGLHFRLLLVSATERGTGTRQFKHDLTQDLEASDHFRNVYRAKKRLLLHEAATDTTAIDRLVDLALAKESPRTIIFVEKPEKAAEVARRIEKQVGNSVILLTGTMRGHERFDQENTEFFKHLKEAKRPQGRIFLVATSAAEVGVNITSEMMLTTLVESDRLLQRLGRLNRFGDKEGEPHAMGYAHIVAIQPKSAERISETDLRRQKTLEYLKTLNKFEDGSVDVSCEAINKLPPPEGSRSKVPLIPRLEPWHICLWSQTSAQSRCYSHDRKLIAAMPDLESWLHGQQDDIPETSVAWRAEVEFLVDADLRGQEAGAPGLPGACSRKDY